MQDVSKDTEDTADLSSDIQAKEEAEMDDLSGGESSDGGKDSKKKQSRSVDKKRGFRRTCNLLWGKLTDHRYGNVFLRALKDDKPNYQEFIKRPMTLTTVKNRVRDEVVELPFSLADSKIGDLHV
ncbi:hypothetical protein DFJ73DRAFT_18746 [Zopfochytrium polystomum]|nr:hypothetical protein DFJ73DRAFT_18746 [Zopfochytrium polystomum]